MTQKPWGMTLQIDLYGCNKTKIADPVQILAFKNELIPAIGMKAFGEPILEHFAHHAPEAAGYSLVQLIETSDITVHLAENIGQVFMEVFSCKSFEPETVISIARKYFEFTSYDKWFFERGSKKEGDYKIVTPIAHPMAA